MPGKITALKAQRKARNRVNVFLNGAYAFSLQRILAGRLHVGQALSEGQIADLKAQDVREMAYERCLHYLSYRPRSTWEMRRYLRKKGVDERTTDDVLQRLSKADLVDDVEFARFWIENRKRHRPRGPWALRDELRRKGVSRDIIESVLEDEDLEQEKGAMRVAEKKLRRLRGLDEGTFRRRMWGYLKRRGFSYEVCRQVTDHFWELASEQEARQ
ncbi:MAG: RecX family transcriptional regulator [Chloroflexota bacterium]|nr:RecX family transcriptional regulator [Chloroflexota bacterium]